MRTSIQRAICFVALAGALATDAAATTPVHVRSQRFGGTLTDAGRGIAVDGSGNVLVAGDFSGTVNFGGGNLVSAGSNDIFIAKYNAAGAHQWSKSFGSTTFDIAFGVAVDGSDNVLLVGYFNGTVNFGGGNLVSAGSNDIFIAKYNSAGVHTWSQRFGGTGTEWCLAVAVDGSDNVVVTGNFQGTVNFGGANLVSAGSDDIFVAKYNAAGVHQWSQRFGSTLIDDGFDVAVDASDNVVVTGLFQGTVNFGGNNLVSAGANDIFIAKYNSAGVHQWSLGAGGTSGDTGYAVAVDGSGGVFATGYFQGTVSFGGSSLVSVGTLDIFLVKYNSAGAHQWSQRFGSAGGDQGEALAVDGLGNVLMTGLFTNTVNFGGGNLVSAGGNEIFIASYDPSGTHEWSDSFGSTSVDLGHAIAVDGSSSPPPGSLRKDVLLTGSFEGTVNFGGNNLVSAGAPDIFVARYNPALDEPTIASIVDVGNDQGRSVKISFIRSGHDNPLSPTPVAQYVAYRRDDPLPAAPPEGAPRAPQAEPDASLLAAGWIFAGSVPAFREGDYRMIAPTLADSTIADGQHHSVFFIRAATFVPGVYFDSPPDSGYSLDNLAPGIPGGLVYSAGTLTWNESAVRDFDYFSVYGGGTNAFGAATFIDYTVGASMNVNSSPYTYYFVTATDFSGNEGKPTFINALTGIGDTPKSYVLSVSAYPNPFNPSTTLRYTLPSKGQVTIAVYDARGVRVATLLDQEGGAGAFTVPWDGRIESGATASSGVYFARIEHSSGTKSYKMVLLK